MTPTTNIHTLSEVQTTQNLEEEISALRESVDELRQAVFGTPTQQEERAQEAIMRARQLNAALSRQLVQITTQLEEKKKELDAQSSGSNETQKPEPDKSQARQRKSKTSTQGSSSSQPVDFTGIPRLFSLSTRETASSPPRAVKTPPSKEVKPLMRDLIRSIQRNDTSTVAAAIERHPALARETFTMDYGSRSYSSAPDAVVHGHIDVQYGRFKRTLLHEAVKANNKELIRLLIKHGADVNACFTNRDKPPETADPRYPANYYSETPLSIAVKNKNEEVIQLLLDNGASVELKVRHTNGYSHYIPYELCPVDLKIRSKLKPSGYKDPRC